MSDFSGYSELRDVPAFRDEAEQIMQRRTAAHGTLDIVMRGGDPLTETPRFGGPILTSIEMERQWMLETDRAHKMKAAVFDNPELDVQGLLKFKDDVRKRYEAQNKSELVKVARTPEEQMIQAEQLKPVRLDPNEVALRRQQLAKIQQAGRQIDPRFNVYTDPRFKSISDLITREYGEGQPAYVRSGEQAMSAGWESPLVNPIAQAISTPVLEAFEGVANPTAQLLHGSWDIANQAIRALGGPDIGTSRPFNYIEGADGKLYDNGGKVPSTVDGMVMLWAAATGRNIEQTVTQWDRTRQLEIANRNGFEAIVSGAARLGGELAGMQLPGGIAMHLGGKAAGAVTERILLAAGAKPHQLLTQKGLQALGALRLGPGLEESSRAVRIIQYMGKGVGASIGNGVYEATAYGSAQGYGHAFLHGVAMTPVLMTLGALGKGTEWAAKNRVGMPEGVARLVGKGMEGLGFGAFEIYAPELLPSAWGFVKNPSEESWATYAKNAAAFMLLAMAHRGQPAKPVGPGELSIEGIQEAQKFHVEQRRARRTMAESVARGDVVESEEAGKKSLKKLGEASIRAKTATTIEERAKAEVDLLEEEYQQDVGDTAGPTVDLVNKTSGTELVEGAEPRPLQKLERKPGPLGQMIQEGGEEGLVPEKVRQPTEEDKRKADRRLAQSRDPLEDPRFGELPDDVKEAIFDAPGALARKKIFAEMVTERRVGERRADVREPVLKGGVEASERLYRDLESQFPEDVAAIRKNPASEESRLRTMKLLDDAQAKGIELPKDLVDAVEAEVMRAGRQGQEPVAFEPHEVVPRETSEAEFGKKLEEQLEQRTEAERPAEAAKRAEAETPTEEFITAKDIGHLVQGAAPGHGERAGPGSLAFPPTRQMAATTGDIHQIARDVVLDMQGRPGRKGIRVPFTENRLFHIEGDPVQVPIRGGEIRGKALGLFKYYENLIRSEEHRDLVVLAHEWSHAMHRHMSGKYGGKDFDISSKEQYKKLTAAEKAEVDAIMVGYPGIEHYSKYRVWREAWAEWNARNLLGDISLDSKFPHLSRMFRQMLLDNPALKKQYDRIQLGLYRYNMQGAEKRVGASIVRDIDKETEAQKGQKLSLWRRAAAKLNWIAADDMALSKQQQEKVLLASRRNLDALSIEVDPMRTHDALAMTASKQAAHYIVHGFDTPAGHIKGINELLEPLPQEQVFDLYKYLVSIRNLDLQRHGMPTQQPAADYAYTIKEIQARHPHFAEIATGFKRWTDALVDVVASSGNLDIDKAQRLKDTYFLYIPFFRALEGPARHAMSRGVAERGEGIRNIEGSTLEVRDPLRALFEVAVDMIAKANQNTVMTAGFKGAMITEGGGMFTVVPKGMEPHTFPVRQALEALEKKVSLPDAADQQALNDIFKALKDADALDPDTITLFTQKVIPRGKRSVIAYTPHLTEREIDDLVERGAHRRQLELLNHNVQWLETDTAIYESLMGLDKMPHIPERLQGIMRFIQAPRDLVRLFATGIQPGFVAANMIRDAITYPIFSRDGKLSAPLSGFKAAYMGGKEFHAGNLIRDLFDELGASTATLSGERLARDVLKERHGAWDHFQKWVGDAQDFLAKPESYLRTAEFKKAYEAGIERDRPMIEKASKDAYERAFQETGDVKKAGIAAGWAVRQAETRARLEALEASKELMNFARAGVVARIWGMSVPYLTAGLAGKRKMIRQLMGGEGRTDAEKARIQRAAVGNAIANITLPSVLLWLANHDEEWYQDLPEWRKMLGWNIKITDDFILTIPKPFEMGILFGTIPEILMSMTQDKDEHAASLYSATKEAIAGGFLEGIGSLLPAIIKPLVEQTTNYDFFRKRELTPEWISRSQPSEEQATFYTTATARILSKALGGLMSPIEIEHMLGGYTAGAAVAAMRASDEIFQMKEGALGMPMPWTRFISQRPHGQSAYVDDLYKLGLDLEQRGDALKGRERGLAHQVDAAKKRISLLRKQQRAGRITTEEAERRSYEIARPLVEKSKEFR